jgi:hypothetical protein
MRSVLTCEVPLPFKMPVSVVDPVPPFATPSVPPSVIVPELVTGPPEVVSPVVPPDTATELTVPLEPPSPMVEVATRSYVPFAFPISNFPYVGEVEVPVPPEEIGNAFESERELAEIEEAVTPPEASIANTFVPLEFCTWKRFAI